MVKRVLKEAGVVLLIAFVLAVGATALNPAKRPLLWPSGTGEAPPDDTGDGPRPIDLAAVMDKFELGQALFVDARPEFDYTLGHIPGALHRPEVFFDDWIGVFMAETDPTRDIITYCAGAECDLAVNLATKLTWAGFENVYYFEAGWDLWVGQGLPTETGP
jgi:ArsR family transcriptional regulator